MVRTLFQLSQSRSLAGIGASETPEVRALPWNKPSKTELRKEAFMGRLQEWGIVVGLLGGAVGLYLSMKALRSK